MKTVHNTIFNAAIRIIAMYINCYIRNKSYRNRNKKSARERIDDLKERVTDLEITAEVVNEQRSKNEEEPLGWENFSEAKARAKELPALGWVVPGLIPEESICNLVAVEKAGKSILATQIAYDYSSGRVSDLVPKDGKYEPSEGISFLYDAELTDDAILQRYEGLDLDGVYRCPNSYFDTPDELIQHVKRSVSDVEANTLVVVDNASAICPNFHGNYIKKMRYALQELQNGFKARGYRLTIIFVHHVKPEKSVFDDNALAGFKEWDRLGTLRLCLGTVEDNERIRLLGVKKLRTKEALLKENEVIVLNKVETPYLHFVCERITSLNSIIQGKSSRLSTRSFPPKPDEDIKKEWTLSDDEKQYVREHYIPNEYGSGKLAKDIFEQRGWEKNKKDLDCLETYIKRFIKGGLK